MNTTSFGTGSISVEEEDIMRGANDHPYRLCVATFRTKILLYSRYMELAKGPPRDNDIADEAITMLKDIENSLYLALDTAYLDGRHDGLVDASEYK